MNDYLAVQSCGILLLSVLGQCILRTEAVMLGKNQAVAAKTPNSVHEAASLLMSGPVSGFQDGPSPFHFLQKRSAFSSLLNRVREQMQRSRAAPELPEAVVAPEPAIVAELEAVGAQMAKDTPDYPDVPTVLSPRIATICYMNPVSCFGRRRMWATKYDNLDKRRY